MAILRGIAKVYIESIRGTLMLVQILIVYFGIPQALRPLGFSWLRYGGVFSAGVVLESMKPSYMMKKYLIPKIDLLAP